MMIPFSPTVDYKTIILIGLGREGVSSYRYLQPLFPQAHWLLADDRPLVELDSLWQRTAAEPTVRFIPLSDLATLVSSLAGGPVLVVKTAGIPIEKPGIQACLATGATLTSNTALFLTACKAMATPPQTIGVTGTKGKSTTASMIYHVLKENGVPIVLTGNIGIPPLEALQDAVFMQNAAGEQQVTVVLELSSHQLRELTISPQVAVIQDITPEHLDYYVDFAHYLEAKAAICQFQTEEDRVLYNPAYAAPTTLARRSQAKKLLFSLEKIIPGGTEAELTPPVRCYARDGWLWFDERQVIALEEVPLLGQHNLLNTMPALCIALALYNLPVDSVANAIRSFTALPHRLEYAGTVKGVRYYNDSQATTPEATIAAVQSFPSNPMILLVGGSDKGVSFEQLGAVIAQANVTHLLLFPPMGENIAAAVKAAVAATQPGVTMPAMTTVHSMSEAVTLAAAAAKPGSVVLLSPACASFGLFKNYQDRGDQFKAAVQLLPTI